MLEKIQNMFKIPELRRRILFTLALLAVYRLGCHLPTPGIDAAALAQFFESQQGTLLSMVDLFSGGALRKLTVFALGIMPYISASIILQLLIVVIPSLEKLSKEGEAGKKKITMYTRYGTAVLSMLQGFGIGMWLEKMKSPSGAPIVIHPGLGFKLLAMITLTAGTAFIMWLGEQISERGIGNGISLIIFAGIIARLPAAIGQTLSQVFQGELKIYTIIILVVLMVGVVALVVVLQQAQRRLPIQHAKRVIGRRLYGGQTTYLPLRVNTAGVIPVIFASSIIMFPATAAGIFGASFLEPVVAQLTPGRLLYNVLYVTAIIFFAYFYTSIIFNPTDVADNLRKSGANIPGKRAGKVTAEYINQVLSRLTFGGGVFLAGVSVLPAVLVYGIPIADIPLIGERIVDWFPYYFTHGLSVPFWFGGTALLIVVGVALDTVQQIEAQMVMRHYDGFVKKGRIRGRR
ncbi:MAG TPA: preprotein translocase subunit SecY [bacterium]|nr:preprotein translocase subunit SecY [bacterium]